MLATPLAYARLWDNPEPLTSQRRALAQDAIRDAKGMLPRLTLLLGGNRTGKSVGMAQWAVAQAGGLDAYVETSRGRFEWVRAWLARNGFPESMVPAGPGRIWAGSPAFGPACEQIRPHLFRFCPVGTRRVRWDQPVEAELRIPAGGGRTGVIVSKAYKQYDQDNQTWEGANVRGLAFDEQPNSHANLLAGMSRLIDQNGRAVMALTPLRGKNDWLYTEIVQKAPPWLRVSFLHGAHNPHIPQAAREELLAMFPDWQRAARDTGAFTSPEGQIYPMDRGVHVLPPFPIPVHWLRWQATDWGTRNPHALWAAEAQEPYDLPDGRRLETGDLVVYRELALRINVKLPSLPTEGFIRMIAEAEAGQPEGLALTTCYRVADSADPDAIAKAASHSLLYSPAAKEPGSLRRGLDLVEALLNRVDAFGNPCRPRLYFTEAVPVTIEEMEGLRWGPIIEGREPQPDPVCPDHAPDCIRYLVRYRASMGIG